MRLKPPLPQSKVQPRSDASDRCPGAFCNSPFDLMKDQPEGELHPIESKYMAGAAVVGFLLTLLLTAAA